MKTIVFRIISCLIGFLLGVLIFGMRVEMLPGVLCVCLLCVFYIFIRPIMQLILMPFNMFLAGLVTIAGDALLVCWAIAWTPGVGVTYAQALLFAALIAACFAPYVYVNGKKQMNACRAA